MRTRTAVLVIVVFGLGVDAQPPKPAELKLPEVKSVDDLPDVDAKADDPAEVKLAKEVMRASVERYKKLELRRTAGQLAGGVEYMQFTQALADLTDAADDAFPEPKDRLPWFVFREMVVKRLEVFNAPRVKEGVEEPQLLPQLQAERAKAELALLKLKKKLK